MKVNPNFHSVYLNPLSGNRFEGYHLSSTRSVERIRVNRTDPKSSARCSEEFLRGLMSGQSFGQSGLMIGLASNSLPRETLKWIYYVGLKQDLKEWLPEIVLCSHIHTVKGNNWAPGFLIDGTRKEEANPFSFSDPLVRTVTRGLVVHPYITAFLNFSHPNGKPLTGLEHFTFLAYAVGYLKFSSNDLDYECKNNLAIAFLRNAIRKLPVRERGELLALLSATTADVAARETSKRISGERPRRPSRS